MPNICDNRLAVEGPRRVVEELARSVEGDEQPLDFGRVVPMPDRLGCFADTGAGSESGVHDWRLANWGVKWNAWGATRQGYGRTGRVRYRFFTPYGPPIPVLDQIAERWPPVMLTLTYGVELMGEGRLVWREGTRVAQSPRMRGGPSRSGCGDSIV
jgi:hypothetical protein